MPRADGNPAAERLRELQRLRDNDLITGEEFDEHRARILDEAPGPGDAPVAAGSPREQPAGDTSLEPGATAGVPARSDAAPPASLAETPAAIDALLAAVEEWRQGDLIDDASAARLREHYGRRRAELVGPAPPVASTTPPVAADRLAPPSPPAARRPHAAAIGDWATRRQADVLLYVGAFLLVISALIFASSQDEALSGGWRVVLLVAYTAGFLLAGWLLRRRARVREAGPVFLAIGALMTPLNFLLLHSEVLSDQGVPGALVWFIASAYSAAFYGFLAARGLGRLYAVPAGIALLSAWGSLAVHGRAAARVGRAVVDGLRARRRGPRPRGGAAPPQPPPSRSSPSLRSPSRTSSPSSTTPRGSAGICPPPTRSSSRSSPRSAHPGACRTRCSRPRRSPRRRHAPPCGRPASTCSGTASRRSSPARRWSRAGGAGPRGLRDLPRPPSCSRLAAA